MDYSLCFILEQKKCLIFFWFYYIERSSFVQAPELRRESSVPHSLQNHCVLLASNIILHF